MSVPKQRALPDKESKLFKELLMQYELKQYKKGIKAADTILKKFPNHGETIALKALTIHASLPFPATASSVPKLEEAEAMARLAVKKDITSHITWHVLGIMAKSRKDWEEASRAFAMARKQDPDNIPLLRDSIALYLHTRQYAQAVATRHHYLLLRPPIRGSWLGLVVAHELNGDLNEALGVYDDFASCVQDDGATGPEKSQIRLYIVKLCIKAGKFEDGLRRLEDGFASKIISPRGEASQLKAELLEKLGRTEDAEDAWRAVLEHNPDNHAYYEGFLRIKGFDINSELDEATTSRVLDQLASLAELFPRSASPKRIPLDLARGEVFRDLVRKYLINGLERGIPSLFVDVKGVYRDQNRMRIVGEVMEEIVADLEKDAGLHGDDTIPPPTTLLWAYYFLALHCVHPSNPNPSYQRALDMLQIAIDHTPTLPELYMARARILKRAGDPLGAAQSMEEARLLDLQDRFLNGKAAKYWMRAGDVKTAEELLVLFTKKDLPLVQDLTDLQCLWFLVEEGNAHNQNGNLALSLKRYQTVVSTFKDYEDDQYDFHTYCMRRMTLSAYTDLMAYEDQLRSHPEYLRAALGAIDIYTRIYDDPSLTVEIISPEEEAERKRAAKKAQKAEQKAKKAAASAAADGSKKEEPPLPDADPNGEQLIKTETPLEDAYKVWLPLEKLAARRVETWLAGYRIQIRRKLYLAALKCLLEASALDPENAELHPLVLHFKRSVSTTKDVPENVRSVIHAALSDLLPSSPLEEFNSSFRSRHAQAAAHILGAAQGLLEIKRSSDPLPADTAQSVRSVLDALVQPGLSPNVRVLLQAVDLLKEAGATSEDVDAFKAQCRERMPLAWVFASAKEHEARKAATEEPAANGTAKSDV